MLTLKKKYKILAVILARSGSKGVKKKNITNLCGHPLISYSIYAAKKSKFISKLVISTDSKEIKKFCENYGAEVPFIRPKKLALDHIWSRDALKHAVLSSEKIFKQKYDFIVELPAVAPFRTSIHIDEAIKKLVKLKTDSVISVSRVYDKHPIRIKKISSGYIQDYNRSLKEGESSRRQDLPAAFVRNGAIYAMKRDTIIKKFSRKGKLSSPLIMENLDSINIDEMADFYLAESLIKKGFCKNYPAKIFIEKKIENFKANKRILITYNKKIAKKIFEKKINNCGIVYCDIKNLNNLREKENIIACLVSIDGEILINNKFINQFKNLKYIFSPSTGLTHIDQKSLKGKIHLIYLNNLSKTKNIKASSEFTISLILTLIRNLNFSNEVIFSGNWRNKEDLLRGNEISGFNFGIFGFGRIGKNVSNFLKIFTKNICYYDPYVKSKLINKEKNIKNFLKKINFLIISSKLTDETKDFFNFKILKLLPKNSYIVNVSRGELIIENDLIKLINLKHIKKVALDVLRQENKILHGTNKLIKLSRKKKNIFITPHIAGLTYESEKKALIKMKELMYKKL